MKIFAPARWKRIVTLQTESRGEFITSGILWWGGGLFVLFAILLFFSRSLDVYTALLALIICLIGGFIWSVTYWWIAGKLGLQRGRK
jgi:membrane-associated HD superfamily phosphohydrolase